MIKRILANIIPCVVMLALSTNHSQAQFKYGEAGEAHPSAVLEVGGTTTGFLLPRLTTVQRNAINMGNFPRGLTVYNTDNNCIEYWNNTKWVSKCDCPAPTEAIVTGLQCQQAVLSDTVIAGRPVTAFIKVPYTGGNGGAYRSLRVSSTTVTGLQATAPAGVVAIGNDTLLLTLTGTPSGAGTAAFVINLGGQGCAVNVNAKTASVVTSLTCGAATGQFVNGQFGTGSIPVSYTGGNGGAYQKIQIKSTGVTGLTAYAPAGNVRTGSGVLNLSISGTPSGTGTASFTINQGGMSCTFTVPVADASSNGSAVVNPWTCTGTLTGTLTAGVPVASVTKQVTATVTKTGSYNISILVNGVTFSDQGNFTATGNRTITLRASGTPAAAGTFTYPLNTTPRCSFTVPVANPAPAVAEVNAWECGSALTGTMTAGVAVTGVSKLIRANVTRAGTYNFYAFNNGVVFSATGTFPGTGLQNILLQASGTPFASGTFPYTMSTGTNNLQAPCGFTVTVGTAAPTLASCGVTRTYGTVTSVTGRVWLDRNLGADRVATSAADAQAVGHLYQWGRSNDGHQCPNSPTLPVPVGTITPGPFFISTWVHRNWINPDRADLWQGVNGPNNPCPAGFRVPTLAEVQAEMTAYGMTNAATAFASPLRLAGNFPFRNCDGEVKNQSIGYYWTSTVLPISNADILVSYFGFAQTYEYTSETATTFGFPVRCIRNN